MRQKKLDLLDAEFALKEIMGAVNPQKQPQIHNITIAMMGVVNALGVIQKDVGLLHNRLQPVLDELRSVQQDLADLRSKPKGGR